MTAFKRDTSADFVPNGKLSIAVRDYLERVMDERDRFYDVRFRAAESAVGAALAAAEKQTNASFAASEKAIVKAEDAQREYNVRSNEFRGQLDDQAKLLISRTEANTMFKALEDKLLDAKKEIAGLRESRSEGGGKSIGLHAMWGYVLAAILLVGWAITTVVQIRGL